MDDLRDFNECENIINSFLNQWDGTAVGHDIKNERDNINDSDIESLNDLVNKIEDIMY